MVAVPFVLGLLSGALNSIVSKAAYQTQEFGASGKIEFFDKPWFMSLVMFLAMAAAFPFYYYFQHDTHDTPLRLRSVIVLIIPAALDLFGTSLQQMGLTRIPVSTFQMLKGSILIFSAFFSATFLKRRMQRNQQLGVCICFIALAVVGLATVLIREDQIRVSSVHDTCWGIALVLFGQVVCAAQYVLEEYLLKPPLDVPSLAMVGVEGIWGSLLMLGVLPLLKWWPGNDNGSVEDWMDSISMVSRSATLQIILAAFFISCLVFNICGVIVTQQASAMHHTFLDASRTIFVWLGSLWLFYCSSEQELGEPLTTWSWLQASGFILLILGQLLYDNRLIPAEGSDLFTKLL